MMNVEELRKDTKKAAPLFKKSPAGQCRHIGDYVVETKKGLLPMKRTVPVIPLSSNAGVMRPQCVLFPSQPSECEEV